ncbi:MAG: peptide deformylase [Patescibacteria group bacterium]
MKKEDIIVLPNPSLRQKSKKVSFVDDSVKELIDNMVSATLDWEENRNHEIGVALAAVQINDLRRVVIIKENFGKIEEDFEGCLSVSDMYGKVPRYTKVKVEAQDLEGNTIRVTAEGFLARIFQHEIDHTNGKLFVDHIKDKEDNFYKLKEDGQLEQLDYEKDVKQSNIFR